MILSIDKQAMTAQVQLYRGANEVDVHALSWWSMNPDVSRMYGVVRTQVVVLPIKEIVDWYGEDRVVFAPNHPYVYGQYGELRNEVAIPPHTVFSMDVREDTLFAVGRMQHVNMCIGSAYIGGAL